jgi:hypothetical protein
MPLTLERRTAYESRITAQLNTFRVFENSLTKRHDVAAKNYSLNVCDNV